VKIFSGANGSGTELAAQSYTIGFDSTGTVDTTRPEAVSDSYALAEDGALTVDAVAGVLANDSDPEGDPLTALIGTGPANGVVTLAADGSFVYTPDANFFGTDSFTYQASDGSSRSTQTTVELIVAGTPDAPVAAQIADQNAAEGAGFAFTVPADAIVDPDGDALSFTASLSNGAALPSWLSFDPASRTFSGTVPADSLGTVISVRINGTDPDLQSAFADFDITVTDAAGQLQLLLIDPVTDTIVRTLSDTDTITPADLTGTYNLQATYDGAPAGSVQFWIDGTLVRTENGAPYAAFGDNRGDFRKKSVPADGTSQAIEVKVFSGANASGTELAARSYTIDYGPETSQLAPIVIDFNYDGEYFSDFLVAFDYDGDGEVEYGGWASPQDGILALDRNADGVITDGSEISFVQDLDGATTDLEGLAAYDSNNDGVFSVEDQDYDSFVFWIDANANGRSDAGELASLVDAGIRGIDLMAITDHGNLDGQGAIIHGIAAVEMIDGGLLYAADASLIYSEWLDTHDEPDLFSFG